MIRTARTTKIVSNLFRTAKGASIVFDDWHNRLTASLLRGFIAKGMSVVFGD